MPELAIWGGLGGGLGWVAGAVLVGVPLAHWNPLRSDALDDGAWTPGFVIGFQVGEALGIPVAVHRASGGRGDLRTSILASMAIAAVGTALLWSDNMDEVLDAPRSRAVLVAVPVAQLITSIWLER